MSEGDFDKGTILSGLKHLKKSGLQRIKKFDRAVGVRDGKKYYAAYGRADGGLFNVRCDNDNTAAGVHHIGVGYPCGYIIPFDSEGKPIKTIISSGPLVMQRIKELKIK